MWIIILSVLALYVIFIMCLLISGNREDDHKEALFASLTDRTDKDYVASSSIPAMPEHMQWKPVQRQESPLKGLLSRVS